MATTGVEQMVWEFLRINASAVSGNFLTDIVNLIIIPTVFLIVFLEFAAGMFVRQNNGLKHVFAIALYLVIITQGFYGPFALFASGFAMLLLILAGVIFFTGRMISGPGALSTVGGSKILYDALTTNTKTKRDLIKKREYMERKIHDISNRLHHLRSLNNPTPPEQQEMIRLDQEMLIINRELTEVDYKLSQLRY